jgi:hypothetical protein
VIVGFLTQVFKALHKTKFTSKEMLLMWMEEGKSPGKKEAVSELTNWIDSLPDDEEEPQIEKSSEGVKFDVPSEGDTVLDVVTDLQEVSDSHIASEDITKLKEDVEKDDKISHTTNENDIKNQTNLTQEPPTSCSSQSETSTFSQPHSPITFIQYLQPSVLMPSTEFLQISVPMSRETEDFFETKQSLSAPSSTLPEDTYSNNSSSLSSVPSENPTSTTKVRFLMTIYTLS